MMKRLERLFSVVLIISVMMSMMGMNVYAGEAESGLSYICGQTVHTHTDGCYSPTCTKHVHSEACRNAEELICGLDEDVDEICTLEEHTHTESCKHICGVECVHEHIGACYHSHTNCAHIHTGCPQHSHSPACGYLCGKAEGYECDQTDNHEDHSLCSAHNHTAACGYACGTEDGAYTCGKNEGALYCEYAQQPDGAVICGYADGSNDCGYIDGQYICNTEEHTHSVLCNPVHVHTAACEEKVLTCGQNEHVHDSNCVNLWNGAQVSREITAGQNGYTFISHYAKPAHAYEMSNHMVSANGGANNDIPQTLVMLDASKDYTWTPDGLYEFGASNYEVMYCCDAVTGYADSVYYKRLNLEDSSYYDDDDAAHIRAIITNSYPYVSLEQMRANLAAEGFAYADDLTRADVIAAVQAAVWAYANDGVEYKYQHTFDVPTNSRWGTVFHDYTNEMRYSKEGIFWGNKKAGIKSNDEVGTRINALIDHLKAKDQVYADLYQVVITDLKIVDTVPVQEKDGVFNVAVQVVLNNGGSSVEDDIQIKLSVDGEVVMAEKAEMGKTVYDFTVPVRAGQKLDAEVSGTQILPQGVYFYEPAGGRDISQSLVGVAAGATAVYAEASVEPDLPKVEVKADLNLKKVGSWGQALSGAVFELAAVENGNVIRVGEFTVGEDGSLTVEDLLPGTYQIAETAAPEGYQRLAVPVGFTVTQEGTIELAAAVNGVYYYGGVLVVRNNPVEEPYYPPYKEEPPVIEEEIPEEPPVIEVEDPDVPQEEIVIEDPDVPLGEIVIEDPEVPLAEMEEEEVPLTNIPKTADSTNMMLWMMMALLSAAALVGTRIAESKEK